MTANDCRGNVLRRDREAFIELASLCSMWSMDFPLLAQIHPNGY